MYLWNITASGYANSFYAAAAQAGTKDWTAWFFGSLDSENFITVDKPPAALWVMGLSGRIFGFSSASLLIPQALMGVGAVATVYAAVKRVASPTAGLLAGAVVVSTPAAALMFKFNNPDALLVLLMTLGGYFVVRSLQTEIGRRAAMWLAFAGVALGFAFLTKMLQGLLVLPAFGLTYLIAGHSRFGARVLHLLGAAAALIVGAGWWVVVVTLWPADARPYIGGSTDNTVMDLVLGYNGLGRIFGNEGPGGGGGGMPGGDVAGDMAGGAMGGMTGGGMGGMAGGAAGSSFGGSTGLDRLFGSEMGNQISWLIPAALVALVLGLIARGRAPRTDLLRASLILWGGWFIVSGLIFSYMSGTIHPYYTVALTPGIAGMIGTGGYALWIKRDLLWGRAALAAMMLASGVSAWVLLNRNAEWLPALKWILLVGTVVGAVLILAAGRWRKLAAVAVLIGAIAGLGGGTSYAIATSASAHSGAIPSVGPASAASAAGGFGGGGMGGGMAGGMGGGMAGRTPGDAALPDADAGAVPGAGAGAGAGGMAGRQGMEGMGTPPGGAGERPARELPADAAAEAPATAGGADRDPAAGGGMAGGGTGRDGASNDELNAMLETAGTRWSAAVNGSSTAATYELATDTAVMAIGGWSSDPTPTLDEFISYVADDEVRYYIGSSRGGSTGGRGGDSTSSEIAAWVEENFTATTVGSATVYDLSGYTA